MIGVAVLGSTGSIGKSTLDVIAHNSKRFKVVALTARRDLDRLEAQCLQFKPELAVLADPTAALSLKRRLADKLPDTTVLGGMTSVVAAAELPSAKYVMGAIVGAAGLLPALAALKAGKRLLLANKEALVIAGQLFMDTAIQHEAELLPVDSEHNAIFQCLPGDFKKGLARSGISRILLTASGGPFRDMPLEKLAAVTPEQACEHPTWRMGRKISVDSATMMNKGLEIIEACWLFGARPEQVKVVINPQSIIHSLVQYVDGSVLAQMGHPDMRTPIAHALGWPDRIAAGVPDLDLFSIPALNFTAPDPKRFPCLELAIAAIKAGGTVPAILNAANEIAVSAFLERRIKFTSIAAVVKATLNAVPGQPAESLEMLLEIDSKARSTATQIIRNEFS
ncbi:1-deoxy-D-xylulose 5-phosphate reductoisomerase [Achromatium sp. WMS2]|nr:1-deoxy-D-xylulose 5-phosphate reductoisomerase [Achromatium sp. WMS2]